MVVTIVVLLILAGVSISLIVDNNGIIKRSKDARKQYGEAQANEQADLSNISSWIEEQANGSTSKLLPDATEETKPYLPSGFTKEEGTNLTNGLVIKDEAGNEYVWVEVPTSIYDNETYNTETEAGDKKPANKEETDKIEYCLKKYTSAYSRSGYSDEYMADSTTGWFADKTAYDNAKNTMLKSVYENGGFYVGRYEAGISESRTSKETEPTATPVSKQNMFPYTNITRTQAKQLAEKVNSGGYTSSLMFGIQWDLMLAHIQNKGGVSRTTLIDNSTNIGNYYNNKWNITNDKAKYNENGTEWKNCPYQKTTETRILLTTGASETFAKMNIYDVAGNVWEWTLEASTDASSPCVVRGCGCYDYGTFGPASTRGYDKVDNSNGDNIGFRVTLY